MYPRVIYLMTGPAHTPYLVCSLYTLRKYWDGEITVYAWPDSHKIVERICKDPELDAICILREREHYGRGANDQPFDKLLIMQQQPAKDVIVYLDADTTIHGRLDQMFDAAETYGIAATQFCDWTTKWKKIRGRLSYLRDYPLVDQSLVEEVLTNEWPSLNSGIFGCVSNSPVLPVWREWSIIVDRVFIPDECILHLMPAKFQQSGDITVLGGGRWNCSPIYQPKGMPDSDVVVRHFHGDSCVRPNKSDRGFQMWYALFTHCLELNLGGMQEWWRNTTNKYIGQLIKEGKM